MDITKDENSDKFAEIIRRVVKFLCCTKYSKCSWVIHIIVCHSLYRHWYRAQYIIASELPNLIGNEIVDIYEINYTISITNSYSVRSIILLEIKTPQTIEEAYCFSKRYPKLKVPISKCGHKLDHPKISKINTSSSD